MMVLRSLLEGDFYTEPPHRIHTQFTIHSYTGGIHTKEYEK